MAVVPFGTGLAPWRHLVDAESLGPKNIAVGTAVAIVLWEIAFFSFDNEKTTHGVKTPAARIMTRRREALLQNTLYPKDQFSDSNPGTLAMKLYLDEERPAPASRTAARRPEEVRASLPTGPAEERSLWNARVFPSVAKPGDYLHWLWMYTPDSASDEERNAFQQAARYSAAGATARGSTVQKSLRR